MIYKICHAYCENSEDRKDLEQEIVIQIWKAMQRYNGSTKLSTFLYKVGLNTAISFRRKGTSRVDASHTLDEAILYMTDEDTHRESENSQLLYQCINKLNPFDKAIILLYLEGYGHQEISDVIGISRTNVATKIGRIKIKIKELFLTLRAQ